MLDIEEDLYRNGFQDTDQSTNGDFSDEGQPKFTWDAVVEKVALPAAGDIGNAAASQPGAAAGPPKAATDPNAPGNDSALLGLAGGSATGALGASMVQLYFPLVAPVLEQAIRKVTVNVHWKIGADDEVLRVECFYTDTKAVDQASALFGGGGTTTTTTTTTTQPAGQR